MIFDEFSTAPCILTGGGAVGPTSCVQGNPDERCLDPEFGADHLDICPGSAAISGLIIVPTTAHTEVGKHAEYRSYLTFADGKGKDMTDVSVWSVADHSIATIDAGGIVTGVGVGATSVTATYRGYTAFADLDVIAACTQAGMDIVLVFDRSAGMGEPFEAYEKAGGIKKTVLDLCKEAAKSLVLNARLPLIDHISIVSCAGTYDESAVTPYHSNAILHLVLSEVQDDILAAIDSIKFPDSFLAGGARYTSEVATGLGAGLAKAQEELTSSRARPSARKLVVLVSLGYEVYCAPDPLPIAAAMRLANFSIAGICPVPEITHFPCSSGAPLGQMTTWAYVQQMVTCSMFYGVSDIKTLPDIFGNVISHLCALQGNACLYYIPWAGDPPPPAKYRDQLDYFGWINWNVVDGFVDLIGHDLYPLQPGHGLFIDLVGTDAAHAGANATGTIETKESFTLAPGRYRLSFLLAGNLRQDRGNMSVAVSVGSAFSVLITVTDPYQEFTLYSYDFTVAHSLSAPIRFAHQKLNPDYMRTVGLLLDDVKLENLDTSEILITDGFDNENPIL